jgi:hypothetical protein
LNLGVNAAGEFGFFSIDSVLDLWDWKMDVFERNPELEGCFKGCGATFLVSGLLHPIPSTTEVLDPTPGVALEREGTSLSFLIVIESSARV